MLLDFKNGRRWRSGDSFRDPERIDASLAAFIAKKTGLKYSYADAVQDLR